MDKIGIILTIIGVLILGISILCILFWIHWIVGLIGIGIMLIVIGCFLVDNY